MERSPSDSYSLTLRVSLSSRAGTLGEVATAIGKAGGDIGAIDIVSVARDEAVAHGVEEAAYQRHVARRDCAGHE